MFRKESFDIVFNVLFSMVISVALTLLIKKMNGNLSFESFCTGSIPSFTLNFTLSMCIPLNRIGKKFSQILGNTNEGIRCYLIQMIATVFIMSVLMTGILMFSDMGFDEMFPITFVKMLPYTFFVAYIVSALSTRGLLKITAVICSRQ